MSAASKPKGFSLRNWKTITLLMAVFALPLSIIGQAMAYDEPKYRKVKIEKDLQKQLPKKIELREYEPIMVAELKIEADGWNSAARQAFRPLANFIFGTNDKDEKIGMTIPVTAHSTQADQWTVAFVMPDRYTENSLPKPFGNEIGIVTRPAKTMAVITFSGGISGKAGNRNFKRAEERLRKTLSELKIQPNGPAVYAVYNGPFTPFFFRRNEVLLPIEPLEDNQTSPQGTTTQAH